MSNSETESQDGDQIVRGFNVMRVHTDGIEFDPTIGPKRINPHWKSAPREVAILTLIPEEVFRPKGGLGDLKSVQSKARRRKLFKIRYKNWQVREYKMVKLQRKSRYGQTLWVSEDPEWRPRVML